MRKTILLALLAVVLAGCEKDVINDLPVVPADTTGTTDADDFDASLSITTRADGAAVVSYPVAVFIFDGSTSKCIAKEIISSEDETLNVALFQGSYDILAVAGADEDLYDVPTAVDASKTSEVVLLAGKQHTDLMTAASSIDLKPGNTTLTLGFQRRVVQLASAEIRQVPQDVTAVSIRLSPSFKGLTLSGDYGTRDNSDVTLTRQADGQTWKLAEPQYLLVSSESASITVALTTAEGTTNYVYTCKPNELEANYRINIIGTFTEPQTLQLSGVITGATWNGTTDIAFNFDSTGVTGENENGSTDVTGAGEFVAGTFYKNCYVIQVTDEGSYYSALLLHPNEKTGIITKDNKNNYEAIAAAVDAALPTMTVDGVTEWRLPTSDEADVIIEKCDDIVRDIQSESFDNKQVALFGNNNSYFYKDGDFYKLFYPEGKDKYEAEGAASGILRPVTTIRIDK